MASCQAFREHVDPDIQNEMMAARFRFFAFPKTRPQAELVRCEACPRCYAIWVCASRILIAVFEPLAFPFDYDAKLLFKAGTNPPASINDAASINAAAQIMPDIEDLDEEEGPFGHRQEKLTHT